MTEFRKKLEAFQTKLNNNSYEDKDDDKLIDLIVKDKETKQALKTKLITILNSKKNKTDKLKKYLNSMIKENKPKPVDDADMDSWQINIPQEPALAENLLDAFRLQYGEAVSKDVNDKIKYYNFNNISSYDDIKLGLDTIYSQAKKAFKINISFGFIIEFKNNYEDQPNFIYYPWYANVKDTLTDGEISNWFVEGSYIGSKLDLEKLNISPQNIIDYCEKHAKKSGGNVNVL